MEPNQIQEIGRQLKIRRKMRNLFLEIKSDRPSISMDTIYRAFSDLQCSTELLEEIRTTGKRILDQEKVEAEAA